MCAVWRYRINNEGAIQVKPKDRAFAIVCAVGLLLAVAWYLHSCGRTEVHGSIQGVR